MLRILPLSEQDKEAVRLFTDHEIGAGYYSSEDLDEVLRRSYSQETMCSFVLKQGFQIKAVRLSYPPGQWIHGKGLGLHPEKWPYSLEKTAYFQSLFVSSDLQGQGWGGRLSKKSIEAIRQTGAKGIVCHSWKESPHDSSTRYLRKLGFELIAEHPLYWKDVLYDCKRCLKPPCQCTALEMYLNLEKSS